MSSGSAILALVEGIDLLRENVRFPHSVPVESRGAVALHFISYSHIDGSEFALRLHHALRHGDPPVDVFIDGDIQLGKQWDEDVEHAIDDCETFLFVMTHDSVSAQSTAALELKRAFNRKKPIIPLQLHPDAPAPLLLGNRRRLPISDDFDAALTELLDHLRWRKSPEGQIGELVDQLADARRELARAPERSALWRDRIAYLEQQLDTAERYRKPEDADRRTGERISHDQSLDREEGVARVGRRRPRVVNDPPRFVTDYFQDRHHETARLEEYLRNEAVRLIVVSGPESLGKTAMTCRLLHAVIDDQPLDGGPLELDGVVYFSVDKRPVSARDLLAGLSALLPDDIAAKLLAVVRDQGTFLGEQLRTVLESLTDRRIVVLVDAAQDLIDPDTLDLKDTDLDWLLRELLDPARSHQVKVILTTRRRPEPLMAIHRSAQRGLQLDEGLSSPHAENLLRALDRDGKVGLKEASDEALDTVRRRTAGNPFALEMLYALLKNDPMTSLSKLLAATKGMTPAEVADEFLAREAIAVLDATERAVVEALAIYQVPVRPGAVNHLLRPHVNGVDAGPVLEHLAGTQLVRQSGPTYQLPIKYWAHALDRVPVGPPGNPEADEPELYTQLALLRRAADYFEEVSTPPEMWQEFGDLTPQLFQFRLLVRGQDYENAAHLLLEISPYLLKWGYGRELLEGHQGLVGKLDDPMLAQANMGSLGTTLFELGRYEEAVDCYRRAVDLAQPLDDPMAANRWVLNEGSSYYQLGETERALRHYQQARKAVEDAGQQVELRWALAGIALCESDFGHFDLAMRHSEEALELARTAEDAMLEIDLLAYLGNFHGQLGQREPATTQLNRALKRARGEGYRHAEIQCLTDLAELRLDDGEYEEAAKLARGALKANQALGETQLAREAGYVLALAYLCEGAEAEARMAIDQACEYRPRRWTQPALDLQGIVLLRQNRPREAREAFLDAAQEAETLRRGGAECFFALDALGLARLGLACCGDDRQASEAAGRFWDARAITKADRVVRRLALLLDQLALAEQATLVDSVRPYAAGSASSPPPGRTAPAPRSNTSPEPVA